MGQRFALIIGNSHYKDTQLAPLATPQADAEQLADILREPAMGGFDEVVTLVNPPAGEVREHIEGFFSDKRPDDLLLLYFSGHGVRDDQGQLFLAVSDTRQNRLWATGIDAGFVRGQMDLSRSQRKVLILDCCYSGAFVEGAKGGGVGEPAGSALAFRGNGYGRVVLTASDRIQIARSGDRVEGAPFTSVFTRHLLEGLRTGQADLDADGEISVDELYNYVHEKVVLETGSKQTPVKAVSDQRGEIILARNPHPAQPAPIPLPAELRQLIESPIGPARLAAVQELGRLLGSSVPGLALSARQALAALAEDDSRSVASAAQAALAEWQAKMPAPPEPAAPPPTPPAGPPPQTPPETRPEVPELDQPNVPPAAPSQLPVAGPPAAAARPLPATANPAAPAQPIAERPNWAEKPPGALGRRSPGSLLAGGLLLVCLLAGVYALPRAFSGDSSRATQTAAASKAAVVAPQATATRGPTSAPIPTGQVVLSEDFEGEPLGWTISETYDGRMAWVDGRYALTVSQTDSPIYEVLVGHWRRNAYVSVLIAPAGLQPNDGSLVGVLCHYRNGDTFYLLGMDWDQDYSIWRRLNGTWSKLSQEVNSGEHAREPVRLEAFCGGEDGLLRLQANGNVVAEARDTSIESGLVGLYLESDERVPVEAHFDDFVLAEYSE